METRSGYLFKFCISLAIIVTLNFPVISKAGTPSIPQIPAFLPKVESVAATKPMPLDGVWLINTISKKIRIEAGRAYAVDSWLHLFTLKIEPGMVVIKNISPTAPGKYSGEDLPLLGKWDASVQSDRKLNINVAGALAPVSYKLIPVQLDNPAWFDQEMQAAGLTPPDSIQPGPPAYEPPPPPGQPQPEPPYTPTPPDDDYEDDEGGDDDGYEDDFEDEYEDEYEDDGDDDEYGDDEYEDDDEAESLESQKIEATKISRYSCKGKGVYYSKVNGKKYCFTCPEGYKRASVTRKMNHPKACELHQKGKNDYKPAATKVDNVDGCGTGEFKHKGFCKSCPSGYERYYRTDMYNARYKTGYCIPKS